MRMPSHLNIAFGAAALAGVAWLAWPETPKLPSIRVLGVDVTANDYAGGTHLKVRTRYQNTGCTQILLGRFLINTKPTPSIALPQQQGPTVLPPTKNELVEDIDLDFSLRPGRWHLFTNVVCYADGEPVPAAVVSPTALFDQS